MATKKILSTFCLSVLVFSIRIDAEAYESKIGLGLNYPGISVRYFMSDKISLELKGQYENNILVTGLRSYYYFNPKSNVTLFAGLEGNFLSFKGEVSEGIGLATELFVGGEYFFAKRFSFQTDIGPAWIYLKDKKSSEAIDSIEYIVNFGINYYFTLRDF